MHDQPRQVLRGLLAEYGPSLCDDPRRCEALLRDHCGDHKREIRVLVAALDERVPADLLRSQPDPPPAMLLNRLTRRLQDERGLAEDVARWAVESWALALGTVTREGLERLRRPEADPMPPPGPHEQPTDVRPPDRGAGGLPPTEVRVDPPPVVDGRGRRRLATAIALLLGGGFTVGLIALLLSGGPSPPPTATAALPRFATPTSPSNVGRVGDPTATPTPQAAGPVPAPSATPTNTPIPPAAAAPTPRPPTPTPTPTPRPPTPTLSGPPPRSFQANSRWEGTFYLYANPCGLQTGTGGPVKYYLSEIGQGDGYIADGERVAVYDENGTFMTNTVLRWPYLDFRYNIANGYALVRHQFTSPTKSLTQWEFHYLIGGRECVITYRDY